MRRELWRWITRYYRWRPASEWPPDTGYIDTSDDVLAIKDNGDWLVVYRDCVSGEWVDQDGFTVYITHWRYLPPGPRGERGI